MIVVEFRQSFIKETFSYGECLNINRRLEYSIHTVYHVVGWFGDQLARFGRFCIMLLLNLDRVLLKKRFLMVNI